MAKAKKQETTEQPAAGETKKKSTRAKAEPKAPAAKATAAKATASKAPAKAAAGAAPAVPLIDTNLAAAAAASMVLGRAVAGASASASPAPAEAGVGDQAGDKRETSTFKQLKQGLSKPAGQGLGGILGSTQAGKKSNLPFGGGNQVGRNQTFGPNANRINVPRRTGG